MSIVRQNEPLQEDGVDPALLGAEGDLEALSDGTFEEELTIEQRARLTGWKPPEEFKGDPRRHATAEEWVTRSESEIPVMKTDMKRLSQTVRRMERDHALLREENATLRAQHAEAIELARTAGQAAYARAVTDLKKQRDEAVSSGDVETFRQVDGDIAAMETERAKFTTPPVVPPKPAPEIWPETQDFLDDNPWFRADPVLGKAMIAEHGAVITSRPALGRAEQYELAKKRVMEAFPDKFPAQAAPPPAANADPTGQPPAVRPRLRPVLDPQPGPGGRRGPDPFTLITDATERAEARTQFDRQSRTNDKLDADEWVATYLDPGIDIISYKQRRQRSN